LHAQQAGLVLGLVEGARGVDCDVGVVAIADGRDRRERRAHFEGDSGDDEFARAGGLDGVADALVVPGVDRGAVDDLILVDDR